MIHLSPEEHFVAQQLAREDLYCFTRYMFMCRRGFRWRHAAHHALICDALMRVYEGSCPRLIINIPPRYSKTEIAVVNFMAWALGKHPDCEFIHTSYSGTLAANNSFMARGIVEMGEYRSIFPDTLLRWDSKARDHWITTAGGVVFARGAGGTITGFGAGKARDGFGGAIIIDDPHKADEADSDVIRQGVIEWFQNTLESRKNDPKRTPIIVIMQRLHEEDLAGWLLAGGNGEKWEHLCIPALREAPYPDPDGNMVEQPDPLNRAPGEPLWEAMHTAPMLRQMERASPLVFAGQYQQRPSPASGAIFKPDQLIYINNSDLLTIPIKRSTRGWDFASTDGGGDWTRGIRLDETEDGRIIIRDVQGKQGGPDDVEKLVKESAAMDGKEVRVAIPKEAGPAGAAWALSFARQLHGYIVEASPELGSKSNRASPFAAQVNIGNVMMVRAPWNAELVNEMRMFPNGKFDDQIDAMSRAYNDLVVDQTGAAFFSVDPMLLAGQPLDLPVNCDAVFATIASNTKTGKPGDAVAVVFWVMDKHASPFPLIAADWELIPADGAMVDAWLPSVFERLYALAKECGARGGAMGVFIDDSGTGAVLLQQGQRIGFAHPIESRLTTMGKSERAISVSGYIMGEQVKLARPAYERVSTFRGITRNHFIGELLAFRVGAKDDATTQDSLLDACTYGAAIGVGTPTGF